VDSQLLDSVIGVVFVWFLLSSVLSVVNEGFVFVTHARAKHLWMGIGRLIDPVKGRLSSRLFDTAIKVPFSGKLDVRPVATPPGNVGGAADPVVAPPGDEGGGLPPQLTSQWWTNRPATKGGDLADIRSKTQQLYDELSPRVAEIAQLGRLSKISHVAAGVFSDAVVALAQHVHRADLVNAAKAAGWTDEQIEALKGALPQPVDERLSADQVTSLGGPEAFATEEELRELYVRASATVTGRDVADFFKDNPDLERSVRRAAAAVGVDQRAAAVKKEVESWFEREMEQLSGFYRRQSRKILGILAIPLVLLCHANTISIFDNLRHDASLRQATVTAAVTATETESSTTLSRTSAPMPGLLSRALAALLSISTLSVVPAARARGPGRCGDAGGLAGLTAPAARSPPAPRLAPGKVCQEGSGRRPRDRTRDR